MGQMGQGIFALVKLHIHAKKARLKKPSLNV
jgi:hypothetical protein